MRICVIMCINVCGFSFSFSYAYANIKIQNVLIVYFWGNEGTDAF